MIFTADKLKEARDAGYSDDEIWGYTSSTDDRFNAAKSEGYSLDEVASFFSSQKPKESSIGDMLQGVAMDLEDTIGVIGRLPEALVSGIPAQYQKLVAGTGMPEKSEAIESDLEFQKRNNQELEDRAASGKLGPLGKAFRQAAPSIAGTVMSMGAAIPGGIIGGALSGPAAPVGGFVGAGAASGAVSYRMQGADYLYRAFKQLEENKGSPLTDEEKAGAYEVLLPLAQESALWEAGPEAIGNAVSLGVGKFVFGFGKAKATQLATQSVAEVEKTLARKITEKSAAIAGGATTEVGTETITALGQYAPEMAAQQYVKTGTVEGAPTEYPGGIMQAVKDVAPATLATQALVMGAGGAIKLATVPFANKPKTPEQIAEDNINIDANAESVNLSIDPDDEVSKGLSETIKSTQSNLISKKEIYSSLEPTDDAAQILKLEIKEDENKLILLQSELNKRTGVAIPEVEKQQAKLIEEIIEPEAAITPAAPAPVSEAPAAEVTPVTAEPVAEAPAPTVVEGLQAVSENTATPEQLTELSQSGLVDIVKGQPVINEEGQAVLTQAEAPLPKLTPEERLAEIEAAPVAETPAVTEAPTVEVAPVEEESGINEVLRKAENAATREEAGQIGRDFAALDPSIPPPPSVEYEIVKAISDKANRRGYNADVLTEENIKSAKESGLLTKTKIPKLTEAGRNLVTDGDRAAKDREMTIGDITDRITDQTVSAWDAKNNPASAAFKARISAQPTPAVSETITPTAEGISVGSRIKLGRSPQTYVVEEAIPQTEIEKANNEQSYSVKNERTGEVQVVEKASMKQVGGKKARKMAGEVISKQEAVTPIPEANRYTFEEAVKAVDAHFGKQGIPEGVVIVNNTTDKDLEMRAGYFVNRGQIVINLAYIAKGENLGDIIDHELGHYIFGDPKFQDDFKQFWDAMTPEEQAQADKIINQFYNQATGAIQVEEKQVRAFMQLIQESKAMPKWKQLLDTIKRWINEKLGTNFQVTDRGAMTVLAAAHKRFKSGEQIIREIDSGVLKAAETAQDAEYLAAVERGDMETAQMMVDEAAKMAGYDTEGYHGLASGALEGNIFDLRRLGSNTGASSAKMGFFFSKLPDTAKGYAKKKNITISQKGLEIQKAIWNLGNDILLATEKAKDETIYKNVAKSLNRYIGDHTVINDEMDLDWLIKDSTTQIQYFLALSKKYLGESHPLDIAAMKLLNADLSNVATFDAAVVNVRLKMDNSIVKDFNGSPYREETYASIIDRAKRNGYDSVILKNTYDGGPLDDIYVVFNSEQIKSADPVTYDDAGNVIPLSQRFRATSPDIRRMAAERQQVGGINMGETKKTPKGIIAETQAKLRERFNPSKVTEENTTEAFRSVGKLLGKEGNAFAEELNDITRMIDESGAASEISMGAALFVNDLFEYSVRLASEGQKMLLGIMLTNINRLPTAGVGRSDAGRTMRAAKEMNSIFEGMAQAERDAFTAYAAEFVYGPNPTKEQIDSIKIGYEAAEGVKEPTTDQVIEGVDAAGVRSGVDLVAKINAEIDKAVAPENKDPFVAAIAVMMKLGGDFGFKFSTLPPVNKIKSAVSETIKGGLANYRKKMVSGAATGLETGFWKTLSSQENKPGPLGELDSAQNRELGNIVKSTLVSLGLKGTPPDTKMSIYEQVASILGEKPLSTDKTELADKNIRSEINRKKKEELESTDDPDIKNAIESKWSQIEFAWDEAMARQLNMPVSDALLRRLIFNELKEAKTSIGKLSDLMNEEPVIGTKRQNEIINSVIQKVAGITFEGQNPSDYSLLKEYLGNQLEGMIIANQTKARAGKTKAQIAKEAKGSVELQAEKAESEAQKQIDRLAKIQSDTPSFPPEAEMNPVREAVKNALKLNLNQMFGAKESADIISNFKKSFTSQLVSLGVKEAPASILADVVGRQIEINSLNNQLKSIDRAIEKGPINEIINAIKNTPLEEQQNPKWRYEVMLNYLRKAGLTPAQAERIAKLMDLSIQKRFIEAKEKAFSDAISKTAPWKEGNVRSKRAFKQVIETIRAGALDPARNMISDIAAMNGWTGFSADQYKKLLEFDKILANEESAQVDKAEAYKGVQDIISKSKLPIRAREVIAQYYDAQALSGLQTFSVNTFSPIAFAMRNALIESSVRALSGDIKGISREATVFVDSIRSWANTVAYSFKNNVTVYSNVDYIVNDDKLLQLFRKGVEQFNKGKTERQKADGIKNMLIGMMDYVRRILNALDYGAIQSVNNQNIGKYAMAVMRRQGMNNKEANEMFGVLMKAKGDFYIQLIAAGEDKNKAGVLADEFMISAWIDALDKRGVQKSRIQEALNAALNDAMSTVGRNRQSLDSFREEETNIKDSGVTSFHAISLLEDIAAAANKSESASKRLFARALYGFAITPARVLRETAWFTGYGFVRFVYDAIAKKMGKTSPYAQSLGNDLQRRQRLIEATAGTVATLGLYALITGSTDDPDDKKPFKLTFTGNGPRRKDDAQFYDSWYKVGNKPNSMILSFGKTNIVLNMMRGFEAFTWPAIVLGAVDDWEIRKKQKRQAKTEAGFVDAAIVAGFVFDAGLKRGPYAFTTKSLFGAYGDTGVETIAKGLTFPAKTLIPVLGSSFAMNISNFINDPIDRRTLEGALWSNIPLIGPVVAPKSYNAFGEPALSTDLASKAFKLGVPIVFDIPSDRESVKIHELILKQGGGPSLPTRTQLAQRLDMEPTNKEYEVFVKEYGFLFDAILRENYEEFSEMAPDVYSAVIEKIGLNIRDAAEEKVRESQSQNVR